MENDENATQDIQNIETAEQSELALEDSETSQNAEKEKSEGSAPEETAEGETQITENKGSDPEKEPKAVQELKRQRRLRQEAEKTLQERERELMYLRGRIEAQSKQVKEEEAQTWEEEQRNLAVAEAEKRVFERLQREHEAKYKVELDQKYKERLKRALEMDDSLYDKVNRMGLDAARPEIQEVIKESEYGPQIIGYLADNPEELDRLIPKSLPNILRELGKIEAMFDRKNKSLQPKKVALAPEPITPTSGRSTSGKNLMDLPPDEYIRIMNERNLKKYGRL